MTQAGVSIFFPAATSAVVIAGIGNKALAQGHRFVPRALMRRVMARIKVE